MRLICTLNNPEVGTSLSSYLQSKGIENQLQIEANQDWGSDEYGNATCRVWVIDEDMVEQAQAISEEFLKNPQNPDFKIEDKKKPDLSFEPLQKAFKNSSAKIIERAKETPRSFESPMGPITRSILIICSLLFALMAMTEPTINFKIPENVPPLPVYASPVEKELLYDYPNAYLYVDKFIQAYGRESLHNEVNLTAEGKFLLERAQTTPYWRGFYQKIVDALTGVKTTSEPLPPLFERIREGQIWRLFTPCLLHSDIFHILFNMLWFAILGKQLEQKLGIPRYLFFTLAVGIFSNTLQYLMGGANFIGYSGILCGMLTFIWARQRTTPWEGYLLQKSTFGFIAFFILTMFLIQVASFFSEVYYQQSLAPGIANTAHLSGALIGYLMGKMKFFSQRHI